MELSLATLTHTLDACNANYQLLPIGDGQCLLVWADRGRFYGPFESSADSGILWTPSALASPEAYAAFCREGLWNAGGDRLWIAPEFPFFTKERARFNESYTVQPELDPGRYRMHKMPDGGLLLEAQLEADLYETAIPRKTFFARRTLRPCRNPLLESRRYRDSLRQVRYCGFTQRIDLEDRSTQQEMELEIWNLCQVRADGIFFTPFLGRELEYVDYYAPSVGTVLTTHGNCAAVRIDSCAEHKIGFKAYQTFGRIGYLLRQGDTWTLLIRNYKNNPADRYLKEPSNQPGENGCSLFIYMNDTRGDGFAELETTGETFGTGGNHHSALSLDYWFYRGTLSALKPIAEALLGIDILEEAL